MNLLKNDGFEGGTWHKIHTGVDFNTVLDETEE